MDCTQTIVIVCFCLGYVITVIITQLCSYQLLPYGIFAFHISFSAFSGVGRTGTFIALDQLLKAVDDPSNQVIDVFNTCYLLRKERRYLVQTVTQYAYLYKCLSTYLLKKVHSE